MIIKNGKGWFKLEVKIKKALKNYTRRPILWAQITRKSTGFQ